MRSSVSYILSSSTTEPNMSHPDYDQYAHDHAALLVLIRQIGNQLSTNEYAHCVDRIVGGASRLRICDSAGVNRDIRVRFVTEYPVENNDWGEFQTHRKLLGLITCGAYDSQPELNELCRLHETLKVKYNSTLYDSRCILFGPEKEALDSNSGSDTSSSAEDGSSSPTPPSAHVQKYTTPTNFKTRALFYLKSDLECVDLTAQIVDFVQSLFWVLESKRLERVRGTAPDKMQLLVAPFEKKDFVGLDMESRQNRKRILGRQAKHLADLCLQAGQWADAQLNYVGAVETLKSINDWLWLGAALEGLCATSALFLYGDGVQKPPPSSLGADEMARRYREAIIHYSKYQNASVIETEASFKAARLAIEQNESLLAASFLQNVVYINVSQLSEVEKIQRFECLAGLYRKIGFMRKAAFCQRLAATRYVSPQNAAPNWQRCYTLMLDSLPGHHLSLDPANVSYGWPTLQIQLLQEMVVAAKRMGHSALATRHMTFLLQTMWSHLSSAEQKEFAVQLQSLAAQCEGAPIPLVLDAATVIPAANLTQLPKCHAYAPQPLRTRLQPLQITPKAQTPGPFLFTPHHQIKSTPSATNPTIQWVENEQCQVELSLSNPLPFELRVADMRLLSTGAVFESCPETVILAPHTLDKCTLYGTPRESNVKFELTGYSTHTLGVKSNCHMSKTLTVQIVPSLPQLDVSTVDLLPTPTTTVVTLYQGESTTGTIRLTNCSPQSVPIEMLDIQLESDFLLLDSTLSLDDVFRWRTDAIQQCLPLAAADSVDLTLTLFGGGSFLGGGGGASTFSHRHLSSSGRSTNSSTVAPSKSNTNNINNNNSVSISGGNYLEAQFHIKYSGGDGYKAGYCRLSTLAVNVEVLPSVSIVNWDVLPGDLNSQFYLVLDVVNNTTYEVNLKYTSRKCILIEGGDSVRVPVAVPRCPLAKLTAPTTNIELVCAEHIAQNVNLQWTLTVDDVTSTSPPRHGVVTLNGLRLTQKMLDDVKQSPINWAVQLNETVMRPQMEFSCSTGDCLQLSISVDNDLEATTLTDLVLSLQFYQDHENGNLNYNLSTRVSIVGANKRKRAVLAPHDRFEHVCNVVFYTSGTYKLDLQCSAPDQQQQRHLTAPEQHTWRFTPPISIIVS